MELVAFSICNKFKNHRYKSSKLVETRLRDLLLFLGMNKLTKYMRYIYRKAFSDTVRRALPPKKFYGGKLPDPYFSAHLIMERLLWHIICHPLT